MIHADISLHEEKTIDFGSLNTSPESYAIMRRSSLIKLLSVFVLKFTSDFPLAHVLRP